LSSIQNRKFHKSYTLCLVYTTDAWLKNIESLITANLLDLLWTCILQFFHGNFHVLQENKIRVIDISHATRESRDWLPKWSATTYFQLPVTFRTESDYPSYASHTLKVTGIETRTFWLQDEHSKKSFKLCIFQLLRKNCVKRFFTVPEKFFDSIMWLNYRVYW